MDYNLALKALEQTVEAADDMLEDPLNPLIDMLAHSIARYELQESD